MGSRRGSAITPAHPMRRSPNWSRQSFARASLRSTEQWSRTRIAPGISLRSGGCTVLVRAHDVWVYRGGDRLRVPPEARLFDAKDGLTLVYEHAGRAEVRVYRRAAR